MQSLSKRTFPRFNNVTLELFKRQDGTHRIKYTGTRGDELVFNLSTNEAMNKAYPEEEFEHIVRDIQDAWNENRKQFKDDHTQGTCNLHEFHWIIVARLLACCNWDFKGGARYFASLGDGSQLEAGSSIISASDQEVEEYIRNLKWSDQTPADVRTLVAGNIGGFAQWLRERQRGIGQQTAA